MQAATNKLYDFLTMEDDERKCSIRHEEGRVTWLLELKAQFEAVMDGAKFEPDAAVFHQLGFQVSDKGVHVCLHCKQLAKSRGGACCAKYNNKDRVVKRVVYNMVLDKVASMPVADDYDY